jgi:hypothetical protein
MFADDVLEKYTPKSASKKQEVVEDKEVIKCKWIHYQML